MSDVDLKKRSAVIFDVDETLIVFQSFLPSYFSTSKLRVNTKKNRDIAGNCATTFSEVMAHFCEKHMNFGAFVEQLQISHVQEFEYLIRDQNKSRGVQAYSEDIRDDCLARKNRRATPPDPKNREVLIALAKRLEIVKNWYNSAPMMTYVKHKDRRDRNNKQKMHGEADPMEGYDTQTRVNFLKGMFGDLADEDDWKMWWKGVAAVKFLCDITGGWLTSNIDMLERLQKDGVDMYIVTAAHIVPTMVKLSMMGLTQFFPVDKVFSSYNVGKVQCYRYILCRLRFLYPPGFPGETIADREISEDELGYLLEDDHQFVDQMDWNIYSVGDGEEEMMAAAHYGIRNHVIVNDQLDMRKAHNLVLYGFDYDGSEVAETIIYLDD
eukprot:Platyproteum_vivax@DN8438_c0_g1_i1.p1